jgi:chemotaxis protein MotB
MPGRSENKGKSAILIRREEVVAGDAHGGSWKVAYADFVTAMMAFFLLMWLLNATTEEQRKGLADYFSPNSLLSHNSSGTGQPFGGHTAFTDGSMLSDLGTPQVTVGQQPVVDQVDDDGSDVIAQPRPHRNDAKSQEPDLGGLPPQQLARKNLQETPAGVTVAAKRADLQGKPTDQDTPAVVTVAARRTDLQGNPTDAELQAALEKREKQAFDQAAQQIRDVVTSDPRLAELTNQLAIDMTPEGLRIQIRDADHEAMFPFASAVPNEKTKLLLQKIAPVLAKLTQDISISGHTDAAPFTGSGRTNWELSADRANATRRILVDSGLQEARIRSVTGNAERDLAVPNDPLAAANRRITIQVLRAVRPLTKPT